MCENKTQRRTNAEYALPLARGLRTHSAHSLKSRERRRGGSGTPPTPRLETRAPGTRQASRPTCRRMPDPRTASSAAATAQHTTPRGSISPRRRPVPRAPAHHRRGTTNPQFPAPDFKFAPQSLRCVRHALWCGVCRAARGAGAPCAADKTGTPPVRPAMTMARASSRPRKQRPGVMAAGGRAGGRAGAVPSAAVVCNCVAPVAASMHCRARRRGAQRVAAAANGPHT